MGKMLTKQKADRINNFLDELLLFTKRHGIEIDGCGCCGSPWLSFIEDVDSVDKYVFSKYNDRYDTFEQLKLKSSEVEK